MMINPTMLSLLAQAGDQPSWLVNRVAIICRSGSIAYGTNLPTSDEDFRGVIIEPAHFGLGFVDHFQQYQSKNVDLALFEIRKFFKLAADCNPNIIETLFVDQQHVLYASLAGEAIRENRNLFMSKKARHTFSGYAMSQLKRIDSHRHWLFSPPTEKPERANFNLPEMTLIPKDQLGAAEDAIKKKMESWELTIGELNDADKINVSNRIAAYLAELNVSKDFQWETAARNIGYDSNFIEILHRERQYRTAHSEWEKYQGWVRNRNSARSELERKNGYDTKHALHLVRLMRMCKEILDGEGVIVNRPDAKELLEIRNGSWSYEKLIQWAETQDAEMSVSYEKSTLPRTPNFKVLNQLCIDIVTSAS